MQLAFFELSFIHVPFQSAFDVAYMVNTFFFTAKSLLGHNYHLEKHLSYMQPDSVFDAPECAEHIVSRK